MATLTEVTKTDLYRFFAIAFDAAPGATYMEQLASAVTAGNMTVKQIVNVFTEKEQFTSIYPKFYSAKQFADQLIETVVGTSASEIAKAEAKTQIEGALNYGMSRGDVIYQFFQNIASKQVTDPVWGGTRMQLDNQVKVAQYYTEKQLQNSTDMATLREVIADVTNNTDTSTDAAIEAVLKSAVGQTFSLTTSLSVNGWGQGQVPSANEGQTVYVLLQTTNVPAGTEFVYAVSGISPTDLASGSLSGTVKVDADGRAVLSLGLRADQWTENAETMVIRIETPDGGQSTSLTINDISTTPSSVTANAAGVEEGGTVTFEFATISALAGQSVTYALTGVEAADVVGGTLNGTLTIGPDGKVVLPVSLVADAATEVVQTLTATFTKPGLTSASASVTVLDTSTTPVPTYAVNPDVSGVNEGSTVTYTLVTTNVPSGTTLSYTISGIEAADLATGSLTGTVTVGADGRATLPVTLAADAITEGAQSMTVAFASGATTVATAEAVTVNDTSANVPFILTTGINNFVGNAGNDTFIADNIDVAAADANTLTLLDILDGGEGSDTLNINDATANGLTTALVGLAISNIETVNVRSLDATVIDTTTWTNVQTLNSTLSNGANVTAARTTDVNIASTGGVQVAGGDDVTITAATNALVGITPATFVGGTINVTANDAITVGSAVASGGGTSGNIIARSTSLGIDNIAVYGGADVTVTALGVASTGANGQITVGNAAAGAAASGNVVVNATGTVAGTTIGAITVVGGDTVTVNQTASNAVNTTQTLGAVTVTGDSGTNAVSVINAARAAQDVTVQGVSLGGVVTITDFVAAEAATADSISSVTLANFGATTITSSALSTLNVTGGASLALASGSLTLNNQSTGAGATTFTLNSTGGGFMGAISGTRAAAYTTININSSAATAIADLTTTAATQLNFTGSGATTLTANTLGAALVDINVTGTGGVTLGGALAVGVDFDGGDGNDSITLGATTQGITMGDGDDTVTLTAPLGVGGSVNGGNGFDLLNVATTTGLTATLNAVTGFEALGMTAAGTYDMTGLTSLTAIATANAIGASGTDGPAGVDGGAGVAGGPGTAGTAGGSMDLDGLSNTNTVTISHNITSAGGVGGAGGLGGDGADGAGAIGDNGGAGGLGADGGDGATVLDLAALVDTAANAISLTLNGVTLSADGGAGGAGGVGGNGGDGAATFDGGNGGAGGVGGNGGDGATVINAGQFDNISIISNASVSGLITANILSSTGGAAGAAGTGGAAGAAGAGGNAGNAGPNGVAGTAGTAGNGMLVANNATITISGAADLNIGTIATLTANNSLIVNASALTGDLTLSTLGGNDIITGGAGDDVLDGGAGADNISGGDGADNITGGNGNDVLAGGDGDDTITGGAGDDTIDVGTGTDRVVLDQITGTDTISGFGSGDVLAITHANANGGEVVVTSAIAAGAATALTSNRTYVIEQTVGAAASLKTGGTATLAAADFTATTLTNVAAFLSEAYADDGAAGANTATFVINNGTDSYVYAFDAAAGGTTAIVAAEITLIGVVSNYSVLAADVVQV